MNATIEHAHEAAPEGLTRMIIFRLGTAGGQEGWERIRFNFPTTSTQSDQSAPIFYKGMRPETGPVKYS
jgi:tartrate dehydratase beta subunit/fumarate hydratase class I family protein